VRVNAENGTLLAGSVTDQISLHGLLSKIRDLGVTLLSVKRVDTASLTEERSLTGGTER
jgi:hypothetical protein